MPAGQISVTRDNNRIPALIGTSNSDGTSPVAIYGDASTHRLLVDAGTITIGAISGNKSNNTAAPGSTNLGVLPAIANAAAPSYSEGNQVLLSTDLTGAVRVVIATDQPQLTNKLLVTPDANSAVNVAQFGGTNVVNGGTAGIQSVGGSTATNVALTENPLNNGAQAVSSENAAVTTARKVQLVADLVGKLITLPYANPENFVSGVTAAITDTTNTSVIASAGGSLRNYVTHIIVTNSHATVSTLVEIRDGATTVLYRGYALAAGGGFSVTLPVPLRGTAATAVTASCITTGSNVYVSASGYKGV